MKILKQFLAFLIILILLSPAVIADDYIEENTDAIVVNTDISDINFEILSRRAVVFERNSKVFLFEKNSEEQCAMASTTKILTCTLILEKCNLSDIVTVSSKAANTGGSRLGLSTGATITVNDLLYGLMLCSGNDAAVALAEHCGGSVEGFAELMNNKASELSLTSTHFVTPHGLDDPEHYTTAHDFALLTDYALNNEQFLNIVGTKSYTVTINGQAKNINNTNELLGVIPSVYGVKTGYTSQAGRCLITSAKQDNLDIIVIVFGADTKNIRTNDSANLINYIFSTYDSINLNNLIIEKYDDYLNYVLPYIKIDKVSKNLSTELRDTFPEFYPIKKEDLDSISVSLEEETLIVPIISKNFVFCVPTILQIIEHIKNKKIINL